MGNPMQVSRKLTLSFATMALGALFVASPGLALEAENVESNPATVSVNFGPFIGGGKVSTGQTVNNTNGYELSIDRRFQIGQGISLGPVLEVANAFVSTRGKNGNAVTSATYDNRFVAAGARLGRPFVIPGN